MNPATIDPQTPVPSPSASSGSSNTGGWGGSDSSGINGKEKHVSSDDLANLVGSVAGPYSVTKGQTLETLGQPDFTSISLKNLQNRYSSVSPFTSSQGMGAVGTAKTPTQSKSPVHPHSDPDYGAGNTVPTYNKTSVGVVDRRRGSQIDGTAYSDQGSYDVDLPTSILRSRRQAQQKTSDGHVANIPTQSTSPVHPNSYQDYGAGNSVLTYNSTGVGVANTRRKPQIHGEIDSASPDTGTTTQSIPGSTKGQAQSEAKRDSYLSDSTILEVSEVGKGAGPEQTQQIPQEPDQTRNKRVQSRREYRNRISSGLLSGFMDLSSGPYSTGHVYSGGGNISFPAGKAGSRTIPSSRFIGSVYNRESDPGSQSSATVAPEGVFHEGGGAARRQAVKEPQQKQEQTSHIAQEPQEAQIPEQEQVPEPSVSEPPTKIGQNTQQLGNFLRGSRQVAQKAKTAAQISRKAAVVAMRATAAAARAAATGAQALVNGISALLSNPVGWVILIIIILLIIVIIVVIFLSIQSNSTAATNEVARGAIETSINSSIFVQFGPSIGRNVQAPFVTNDDGIGKDPSDAIKNVYVRAFHQLSPDSKIRDYSLTLTVSFPNSLNLLTPDGKVIDRNSTIMRFNVKGVSSFTIVGNDTLRWECSSNCKNTDIEITFTTPIDLASSGGQILLSLTASELKDKSGMMMPNTYTRTLCYDITNVAGCTTSSKYAFSSTSGSVAGSGTSDTNYSSDGVLQLCPMQVTINADSMVCTSGMTDTRGSKYHHAVDIASNDNQGFLRQNVVSPVTGIIVAVSDPKSELRIGGRWYQIQDVQRPEYIYVIAHLQPNTEPQGKAFDKGTRVQAGQILGKPFYAKSGYDRQYWTGPHIHFQVKRNGQPIDPAPSIREKCGWQRFRCPN